ncbi:hypothetical protein [Nocardia xishanensis]|uniref:Uncharacterized protein n=1 Tax=Nocardia xishanensis TaxID=238964 RepID=A0ABW7X4M9_9NOCA
MSGIFQQYGGWPQLDDRTVADVLADVITRLDKFERRFIPPPA